MIDAHCHLTHPRLARVESEVLARAREAGVTACVTIGTGLADARAAADLSARSPGLVFCAAGIDPFSAHRAGERFEEEMEELRVLLQEGPYVALGEFGLDYHHDLDPRPVQAERFERQLDLARRLDLPAILHTRDAHEDALAILANHCGLRGVIHSFHGGPAIAERYLALGWHLSFTGVLTYRNAFEIREAARATPPDRLLVETDAPYLAPEPHRGRRCEPAHARLTVEKLAAVRGAAAEEIEARTEENARALFGIRPVG